MTSPSTITLDVGGSHVTAARISLESRAVVGQPARLHLAHTATLDELLNGWVTVVQAVLDESSDKPTHLGIAVPGPFDLDAGISQMEHKFVALYGVPLRPLLAEQLCGTPLEGIPVLFGNDADMFALGEWWAGAGRGTGRMLGVTLGTGLGSGFVQQGELVHSGRDVPPGGELWNVPFRDGVSEEYANGAAISRLAQRILGVPLTSQQLAQSNSEQARIVFEQFGKQLAEVLAPWVESFQAERVVLGGNVSQAFGLFGVALQRGLPTGCAASQSEHFEGAALLGAALLKP